jgi:hypothetical protein
MDLCNPSNGYSSEARRGDPRGAANELQPEGDFGSRKTHAKGEEAFLGAKREKSLPW